MHSPTAAASPWREKLVSHDTRTLIRMDVTARLNAGGNGHSNSTEEAPTSLLVARLNPRDLKHYSQGLYKVEPNVSVSHWLKRVVAPTKDGEVTLLDGYWDQKRRRRNAAFLRYYKAAGLMEMKFSDFLPINPNGPLFTAAEELFLRLASAGRHAIEWKVFSKLLHRVHQELLPGVDDASVAERLEHDWEWLTAMPLTVEDCMGSLLQVGADGTDADRPVQGEIPAVAFVSYIALLLEPWCSSETDAAELINEVLLPRCMVHGSHRLGQLPPLLSPPAAKAVSQQSIRRGGGRNAAPTKQEPPARASSTQLFAKKLGAQSPPNTMGLSNAKASSAGSLLGVNTPTGTMRRASSTSVAASKVSGTPTNAPPRLRNPSFVVRKK